MDKYCPKCGTTNKEEDKFCKKCGTALEPVVQVGVRKRFCPKCGAGLREGENFCSSCGTRINGVGVEMASVGARLGSYIIDSIIIFVFYFAVIFILFLMYDVLFLPEYSTEPSEYNALAIAYFLSFAINIGYFTYFFGRGQTLGMMASKIKLCGTDGTYPIGYGKGFLRWIGMIISGLVIGLGYLWIIIDKNKQGWHDKIAGTYVVRA